MENDFSQHYHNSQRLDSNVYITFDIQNMGYMPYNEDICLSFTHNIEDQHLLPDRNERNVKNLEMNAY